MKKKLDAASIVNELVGASSYFAREREQQARPEKQPVTRPKKTTKTSVSSVAVDNTAKRPYVRRTFDFFEDQIQYLTKQSLEERLAGRDVSMNSLVREAIDAYIKNRKSSK